MKRYKEFIMLMLPLMLAGIFFAFVPQGKIYITHTGHIRFFAGTSLEDIDADNYQVASNLNAQTGETAYSVLIKGFEFRRALMQEHFNENYMESDKYPKSTFIGKINNINQLDFDKNGTYKVTVAGAMSIHGITKNITTTGAITIKADSVYVNSDFEIALKDYNISIPSVVKNKVKEIVQIHVDAAYKK